MERSSNQQPVSCQWTPEETNALIRKMRGFQLLWIPGIYKKTQHHAIIEAAMKRLVFLVKRPWKDIQPMLCMLRYNYKRSSSGLKIWKYHDEMRHSLTNGDKIIELYGNLKFMEKQTDELIKQIVKIEPTVNIDSRNDTFNVNSNQWPSIPNDIVQGHHWSAATVVEIFDSDEEPRELHNAGRNQNIEVMQQTENTQSEIPVASHSTASASICLENAPNHQMTINRIDGSTNTHALPSTSTSKTSVATSIVYEHNLSNMGGSSSAIHAEERKSSDGDVERRTRESNIESTTIDLSAEDQKYIPPNHVCLETINVQNPIQTGETKPIVDHGGSVQLPLVGSNTQAEAQSGGQTSAMNLSGMIIQNAAGSGQNAFNSNSITSANNISNSAKVFKFMLGQVGKRHGLNKAHEAAEEAILCAVRACLEDQQKFG